MRSRPPFGRIAATTLEVLAWVGLASALVALLDSVAESAGLGSLYLIAVLAVALHERFGPDGPLDERDADAALQAAHPHR